MSMIHNAMTGANAAQIALNTASQNIANVMTPGYSRQAIVLKTQVANTGTRFNSGAGVDVLTIRRFNDEYKNFSLWQATAEQGEFSAPRPYFEQLEQVMGDDSSSLAVGINKFCAALNQVSLDVTNVPLRHALIAEARVLAQRVNSLNQVLEAQLTSINEYRAAVAAQVNVATTAIAELNTQITAAHASGEEANCLVLCDERERKITALSALVAVKVLSQADGSKALTLSSGLPLVLGGRAATLKAQVGRESGQLTLQFAQETLSLPIDTIGGQLGGITQYEYSVVRPLLNVLNTLTGELAARVNAQLAAGFDLADKPGASLFEFDQRKGSLSVTNIDAASLGFSSQKAASGNSDNLLQVIDVMRQTVSLPELGKVTFADAYAQLIGRLATDSQQNNASLQAAQLVYGEAEKNWKSMSGVNQDSEASLIIEFYKMYHANMKVIAIANKLFDSLLASV